MTTTTRVLRFEIEDADNDHLAVRFLSADGNAMLLELNYAQAVALRQTITAWQHMLPEETH